MKTVGFYYDKQLSERQLNCCLYPNRVPSKDGEKKWEAPKTVEDDGFDGDKVIKYSNVPIVTAIANEDIQISIANEWSGAGGDPIGSAWNTYKPFAPYLEKIGEFLGDLGTTTENWSKQNEKVTGKTGFHKITSNMGNIFKAIGEMASNGSDLLQRSLVVQGTRFVYYSGTGIDFGTLSMRYTLIPKFDENGKYITVTEQIRDLLPYIVGDFVPVTEVKEYAEKNNNQTLKEIGDEVAKYLSWQLPPGGFRPTIKDVDVVQEGTLKLVIGGYYGIENLVVQSAQFNLSKVMAKNPETKGSEYSPLFGEVVLNLRPATKYSRKSLERMISGLAFKNGRLKELKELNIPEYLLEDPKPGANRVEKSVKKPTIEKVDYADPKFGGKPAITKPDPNETYLDFAKKSGSSTTSSSPIESMEKGLSMAERKAFGPPSPP